MANEAAFKRKIYHAVLRHCHVQAMADRFRSGVPDHWYSGKKGDLWIEYKWDPRTKGALKPRLSIPQLIWLNHRYEEGRNVAVIVATSLKEGVIYRNKEWEGHLDRKRLKPFAEIVKFILNEVSYDYKNSRKT